MVVSVWHPAQTPRSTSDREPLLVPITISVFALPSGQRRDVDQAVLNLGAKCWRSEGIKVQLHQPSLKRFLKLQICIHEYC